METNLIPSRDWRNEAQRYGRVSQTLHWMIAALIFVTVGLGLTLGYYQRGSATHDDLILIHKSLGFIILILMIFRLTWFLHSPAPLASPRLQTWERRLAWLVHRFLYFMLFAMPLSGILLSQAAGKSVDIFGLFTLPQLVPFDPAIPPTQRPLLAAGVILHKLVFKITLFVLIGGHLAGVLKHLLIDRDHASLRRMWGR
jgi:cytochrome b561